MTYGLIGGEKPSRSSFEWHLNLGLIRSVYTQTKDEVLRKRISFLALQYLARASHIDVGEYPSGARKLFHVGFFQIPSAYHRSSFVFETYFEKTMREAFVPSSQNAFILIDTPQIASLLPLYFHVAPSAQQAWPKCIQNALSHYQESHKDFRDFMERPLLFDLTQDLSEVIQKDDKAFQERLTNLERSIDKALDQLPSESLKAFIRANVICICRSELKGVGVLKLLPVFSDKKHFTALEREDEVWGHAFGEVWEARQIHLTHFVNITGIRLGGVRGREKVFEFHPLSAVLETSDEHTNVTYLPQGRNVLYYKEKDSLTQTHLFRRYEKDVSTKKSILGQAAVQLIRGLLEEISEKKWKELNANPELRQLLQTTLFRISQHVATALFKGEEAAIELVFSEIATLLALTTPFSQDAFETIYAAQLKHIPKSLRPLVRVGLGKTAMNVFAGILACTGKKKPQAVMVPGIYHEQVPFVGEKNTLENVLSDKAVTSVDVYVSEFNPNINKDPNHHHYKARDPLSDVQCLLKEKPETETITVAIDSTIDFVLSTKAQAFLEHFSEEILKGRIHVIFFRSGQKFDMFGMDNYYGSPFYMIHSQDAHWDSFSPLRTDSAFQTDPLSHQWFCLANKYAFQLMETYREAIFANTRNVLQHIPEELKKHPHIQISSFEKGIDPCFLAIKIKGEKPLYSQIKEAFFRRFLKAGRKVYSKPGFGFTSPNFLGFADAQGGPTLIRINPGLDPRDVDILIQFLNDLIKVI